MIDNIGCMNNTIRTKHGYVDLLNPDPATIYMADIAAALSKICRFGGHAPKFYSVAEHCIHAFNLACEDERSPEEVQAILMHDAVEAFIGDCVKPLKVAMPEYQRIEAKMELAVGTRFNIDFDKHAAVIKHYDRAILKAEKIALWPDDTSEWFGFSEIDERRVSFDWLAPEGAEYVFICAAAVAGVAEL